MVKESHLRSFIKAFSYRLLGTVSTIVISFLVTHKLSFALYIGFFEFISKIVIYYLHERAWHLVPFGLQRTSAPAVGRHCEEAEG